MAAHVPFLEARGLDDVLEHYGFERRDVDEKHDALDDCRLTAKIYKELVKVPEPKVVTDLGWCKE